jgi:hypothetical protein
MTAAPLTAACQSMSNNEAHVLIVLIISIAAVCIAVSYWLLKI